MLGSVQVKFGKYDRQLPVDRRMILWYRVTVLLRSVEWNSHTMGDTWAAGSASSSRGICSAKAEEHKPCHCLIINHPIGGIMHHQYSTHLALLAQQLEDGLILLLGEQRAGGIDLRPRTVLRPHSAAHLAGVVGSGSGAGYGDLGWFPCTIRTQYAFYCVAKTIRKWTKAKCINLISQNAGDPEKVKSS